MFIRATSDALFQRPFTTGSSVPTHAAMRLDLPAAGRAFSLALHGTLAMELTRLLTDDAAFERLWSRPRRTGLKLAMKTLATASAAAMGAARPR